MDLKKILCVQVLLFVICLMIGCTDEIAESNKVKTDLNATDQFTDSTIGLEEIHMVITAGSDGAIKDKKAEDLKEYLALFGESQINKESFLCASCDGVIYVNNGDNVLIYVNGFEAGWMSQIELMDPTSITDSLEFLVFERYSSPEYGYEYVKSETVQNECGESYNRYYYTLRKIPFTYGDTEWLVEQDIFRTEEEALQEEYLGYSVVLYHENSPYAYELVLNQYLVSESCLENLLQKICITEEGFNNKDIDDSIDTSVCAKPRTSSHIFEYDNAGRLAYKIEADDILYEVDPGCVALKISEEYWEIYYYHTDGEYKIGYIELMNVRDEKEDFLLEEDQNFDQDQLIIDGDFWNYSYCETVPFFLSEHEKLISFNEGGMPIAEFQQKCWITFYGKVNSDVVLRVVIQRM